jgi:hypothetical protein
MAQKTAAGNRVAAELVHLFSVFGFDLPSLLKIVQYMDTFRIEIIHRAVEETADLQWLEPGDRAVSRVRKFQSSDSRPQVKSRE